MENQNRRDFLKIAVGAGAGLAVAGSAEAMATTKKFLSPDQIGVLVDTTVCVGCRNCEWACKDAHGIAAGDIMAYNDRTVFSKRRRPNEKSLTVVNEYTNPKNELLPINVKVQCMHCDHPACVSACIVGAFSKNENGAVTWDGGKCIGCRYCMVACPFQVPTYEYDKAIEPNISKCDFCYPKTSKGELPACVYICPVEALTFGKKTNLVDVAREKIEKKPSRYFKKIYGEKEVDGTSWMYLASKDFTQLDFPKLPEKAAPGVSESIQHGIFAYFVPPVMYFTLLGLIMWVNKKKHEEMEEEKKEAGHES
jgi:Fe-S-cluster-containing dehydrogenase component